MQGKPLAQNNKNKGRKASKKSSQRTRRMLPDDVSENSVQAEKQAAAEARRVQKQEKLEARQAKKQAAAEARQAKKLAAAQAREEKKQARQAKPDAGSADRQPQGDSAPGGAHAAVRAGHDGAEEPPKSGGRKRNINGKAVAKYTFLLLAVSAVLSVVLLFALDLTGWRSGARQKVVGYLIEKEREVLQAQMTAEYDAMVDALVEQRLAGERQMLALDQQAADAREAEIALLEQEIDLKRKETEDLKNKLDLELQDFEQLKKEFEAEKLEFETSKIALSEIAALYASMESENAADIISAMNDRKLVVQIFSIMKKGDAAEILELMDAQKAADIISEMGE